MSFKKFFSIFVYVNLLCLLAFSAAHACDRYDYYDDCCNCYAKIKAPECNLEILKREQSRQSQIRICNNTNHTLVIKFKKAGKLCYSFDVEPLCDMTAAVTPAKYSYTIESRSYCELLKKGVQTFKKGTDYNWSITICGQEYISKFDYVPCRKEVYRPYASRVSYGGRSNYIPPCGGASCFTCERIRGLRDSEVIISNDTEYRIYYRLSGGIMGCVAPCSQEIINVLPGCYEFYAKTLCGSIAPVRTSENFCEGYRHHMRVFVKK